MIIVLPVLAAACSSGPAGPNETQELAWIDWGEGLSVTLPDTVPEAESFEVAVDTYHGGCERAGDNETSIAGLTAEIVPFMIVPLDTSNCTDISAIITRRVEILFSEPGDGTVVLHGRRAAGGDTLEIAVEFDVVVEAATGAGMAPTP